MEEFLRVPFENLCGICTSFLQSRIDTYWQITAFIYFAFWQTRVVFRQAFWATQLEMIKQFTRWVFLPIVNFLSFYELVSIFFKLPFLI